MKRMNHRDAKAQRKTKRINSGNKMDVFFQAGNTALPFDLTKNIYNLFSLCLSAFVVKKEVFCV